VAPRPPKPRNNQSSGGAADPTPLEESLDETVMCPAAVTHLIEIARVLIYMAFTGVARALESQDLARRVARARDKSGLLPRHIPVLLPLQDSLLVTYTLVALGHSHPTLQANKPGSPRG